MTSNISHMVVGDQHCTPEESNERFLWLGRMIKDVKPTKVIFMGDFADCYSLNSYDKGTKGFMDNASYAADVRHTIEAQELIKEGCGAATWNRTEFHMLEGNHDRGRHDRALSVSPEFDGIISMDNLEYAKYNDYVHKFLDTPIIDGIMYSHYLKGGNSGRPISGVNHARSLVMAAHQSVSVGHSHLFSHYHHHTAEGKSINGLVTGCYFSAAHGYAKQSEKWWDRGIIMKRHVVDGMYDIEWISLKNIENRYK